MRKRSYFFVAIIFFLLLSTILTPPTALASGTKVTVQQLQKTVATLKKEITALKKSVTTKDNEIKALKKATTAKDSEIASLKAIQTAALQKDNEINLLKEKLARYEGAPTTKGNSRLNPAKLGETVTVEANDYFGYRRYQMTVTEVISGESAWRLIQNANSFNSPPNPGMKYILVKFKVKVIKVDKEPFEINHAKFDAVSNKGVLYNDFFSIVTPNPDLGTDLYNGAEHEGWTYCMVAENDNPLLVMNQKYPDEMWFRLN